MARGATVEETVFEKPAKDDSGLAYLADSVKKQPQGAKSTSTAPTLGKLLKEDSTNAASAKTAPPAAAAPKTADRIHYMKLYQYSSPRDKCQVYTGLLFSVLAGVVLPTYAVVLRKVVQAFSPYIDDDERAVIMRDFLWGIAVICVATYVCSYIGYSRMQISAERVSFKLRARYLSTLMKQEIAYFEG